MNIPLSARERAQNAQRLASDPRLSAWVGASAGSGKTKVLTDRVLRLLLREGTEPGRILCLTFTKAAAAEMAIRLNRRLGRWAVTDDADLRGEIEALTGEPVPPAQLATARKLFCRVLEQPGGMRIATIHAFCQSLLRSFPLEADLPPQFAMLEDADSATLLAEAREAALSGGRVPPETLAALARLVTADRIAEALREMAGRREKLAALFETPGGALALGRRLGQRLGLPDGEREEDLAALICDIPPAVAEQAKALLAYKTKTARDLGQRMLDLLALPPEERAARQAEWWDCLHTGKGELRKALEPFDVLAAESARLKSFQERANAHRLLAATSALLVAAGPVLSDYAARKRRMGALDFDDLIHHAQRLLRDPGSAWVLFKLDGGLDHILLDEAQDTNPAQWGIAEALAEEFFAGDGAREAGERTLFVVGDEKQSIYGFQGADAQGFATWEARFSQQVRQAGGNFQPVALDVSFRSCAPVLQLVDSVFHEGAARAGVVRPDGEPLHHFPDRAGHAGSVEVWPLLARGATEDPEPWFVPSQPVVAQDADALLAETLAARIDHMVRHETLPARGDRPIRPGDIMILVRRRTRLTELLVRQLKRRGVTVGGVDRIALVEQIAVQDMLALCDVLLLPEDDLQLAALLKSPLVGLEEDALFALAHDRDGPLWHRLLQHRGALTAEGRAADWIATLADRADLVTPHALLSEVLGEHGGRAKLLERLGGDAADALDELLNAALRYESRHPPSLQGFTHWLRRGGAEVKREAENAGDAVRILTAHGAKGLQAPVVIIPDVGRGGRNSPLRWEEDSSLPHGSLPLWAPRKEFQARAWQEAERRRAEADAEEENRLLYVALTRAEDRLLLCGLEPKKAVETSWHALVRQGIARCDGVAEEEFDPAAFGGPAGTGFSGPLYRLTSAQTAEPRPDREGAGRVLPAALPAWAHHPAPSEASEDPVAPSRLAGEETEPPAAAPHGQRDPSGRRFRRGTLIHALLQHLPEHAEADREAVAQRHLARPGHGLSPEEQGATRDEVMRVLRHPALADAFGPGSLAEAPLAGRIGGVTVAGQVDRLWIGDDRIVVADYKTNRPPPDRVEDVSPAYLRQMAAYRAVLRAAWPGRRIECVLVWTWSGAVMPLPEALLDRNLPQALSPIQDASRTPSSPDRA
ncbi:double-strand break repair helicase AddA [Roseomonas gilardii]|uniref:DNA 3'-5' helicase n=1 Tax=Roseomonas gilardii TaxID=257708 RepID=A0A1L7AC22_9PROT|nr:double-strand break repair helicase AddA [Roseomonas gilardii]APT56347.1 double-strand break repair helicase AddA [Roseomonas gilardii]